MQGLFGSTHVVPAGFGVPLAYQQGRAVCAIRGRGRATDATLANTPAKNDLRLHAPASFRATWSNRAASIQLFPFHQCSRVDRHHVPTKGAPPWASLRLCPTSVDSIQDFVVLI